MAEQQKSPAPAQKTPAHAAHVAAKGSANGSDKPKSAESKHTEAEKSSESRKANPPRKSSSSSSHTKRSDRDHEEASGTKVAREAERAVSASVDATRKAGQKSYQAASETASAATQTMEKLMSTQKNQFEKLTHEASSVSKDSMEAVIKSGSIFWSGFENIMKTCANMAQGQAEKQAQFLKKAMSSKTLNEWTELQNEAAQESFQDWMSGATKISEMSVKIASDSLEPINNQLSKSIKKVTDSVAA